jgi:uncharacterized phiE125 gp8 family phage protein
MKTIVTAPPVTEPVSLDEAKLHLRIDGVGEDALISQLIAAARRRVETAAGLVMITQDWSVFLDRWPASPILELPLAPIQSIEEVRIYGEDDESSLLDAAHYYADTLLRRPRLVLRRDRVWPAPGRAANGIEIRVVAGYGGASDVPDGLRLAMLKLVAHWYENRGDEDEMATPPLAIAHLVNPYRELAL